MRMNLGRFKRPVVYGAGLLALVVAVACSSSPTGASASTTETFSGTVAKGGTSGFGPFTVAKDGTLTMTVTALSPDSAAGVYLNFGQISGSSCIVQPASTFNYLNPGQPLSFQNVPAGQYCGQIGDIGDFTATETFTVTVAHP